MLNPGLTKSDIEQLVSKLPSKLAHRLRVFVGDPSNYQTLGLWVSSVAAALVSVGFAKLFRLAEQGFHHLLKQDSYWVLIASPILFLLAWGVVHWLAPEASGSGIPQIMAANALNDSGTHRKYVDRLLSLRMAFIKVVSSLFCVLGGGAIGRDLRFRFLQAFFTILAFR